MTIEEIKNVKQSYRKDGYRENKTVNDVITILEKQDSNKYVLVELCCGAIFSDFKTDSWRGSYNMPAIFSTEEPFTVKQCLENLKLNEGKEVYGYKGGEYILSNEDDLFVEYDSSSSTATAIIDITVYDEYIVFNTEEDRY